MSSESTESQIQRLQARVRQLTAENNLLRADNRRLRKILGPAAWRSDGRRGEEFVAELIGGELLPGSAPYDFISTNGVTFEIKCPNLNEAVTGEITQRWVWSHIFGANREKKFERLLLLGPVDHRYQSSYADPESPFVMFDVPFEKVPPLLIRGDLISISTTPPETRQSRISATRRLLFSRYQVTRRQLIEKYAIL